jgi:hypothetical protein
LPEAWSRWREKTDGLRQKPSCGPTMQFLPSHIATEAFAVKILGAFGQILRPQSEDRQRPAAMQNRRAGGICDLLAAPRLLVDEGL